MNDTIETSEQHWWEDGRNVTMLARWYADKFPAYANGPIRTAIERIISIYETPWDCHDLWDGFQDDLDRITNLLRQ